MTWKERCRLVQRIDATLRKDPKNIKWERRWQLKNMDPVARAWLEKNKKAKADWENDSKEKKQVKSVAPPVTATDSNPITKDSLADMSPEDINKNWETVQKLLKQPK